MTTPAAPQVVATQVTPAPVTPAVVQAPPVVAPAVAPAPVQLTGGPHGEVIAGEVIPAVSADAPFFTFGDKVFKTAAELATFLTSQDQKVATSKTEGYDQAIAQFNQNQPGNPPQAPVKVADGAEEFAIEGVTSADEIFENPGKVLSAIEKQAILKATENMEAKTLASDAIKDFWREFYVTNPDLDDVRDTVQMILGKNNSELMKLPTTQAKEQLATMSRTELARIRDKFKDTETLSNDPAVVAGVTGAPAPVAPDADTTKNLAFIDQVRQLQSKRLVSV